VHWLLLGRVFSQMWMDLLEWTEHVLRAPVDPLAIARTFVVLTDT
jgi:hypothetical protein